MSGQNYTKKSVEAIEAAQSMSINYGNTQIEPVHLAYALLAQEQGLVPMLFTKMNIDTAALMQSYMNIINKLPRVSGPGRELDKVYVSTATAKALKYADNLANGMQDEYVSVEHLMLGIIYEADGELKSTLDAFGITAKEFEKAMKEVRGDMRITSPEPEGTYDVLNKYGYDLVERAREQKN